MAAKEHEEKQLLKAERMLDKKIADYEAADLLQKTIYDALDQYEASKSSSIKSKLDIEVFSTRLSPFGKYQRVVAALAASDIDIGAFYWKLIIENIKAKIIDMTNPNKFYNDSF